MRTEAIDKVLPLYNAHGQTMMMMMMMMTTTMMIIIIIITSGQSNLTEGRIVPAHESFNRLQPENVSFKRYQNQTIRASPLPAPSKRVLFFRNQGKRTLPLVKS